MEYDPYSYTVEFAHEKLIFHLKKLGFKRIGDAGVMALFTSRQIPSRKRSTAGFRDRSCRKRNKCKFSLLHLR